MTSMTPSPDVDADTAAGSVTIEARIDLSATRQIVAETSAGSIAISPDR